MKRQKDTTLIILASVALLFCAPVRDLQAQAAHQGTPQATSQDNGEESHQHQHDGSMPGMNMDDDKDTHSQAGAMQSMTHHHHMDSAHMRMTPERPATDEVRRLADEAADTLAAAIAKYKDYRAALADGCHIFAPHLPQLMNH